MFSMKEEYKIGVEHIDKQHERLFEIADTAYETLTNSLSADKYDQIIHILKELKDYTATHFADEEEYMEKIGYKKLFTQKMEHIQFISKLEEIDFEEIDENQDGYLLDLLNYLNDWLVHHIIEKDKQIEASMDR